MRRVVHVLVGTECPRCKGRKLETDEVGHVQDCPSCGGLGSNTNRITLEEFAELFSYGPTISLDANGEIMSINHLRVAEPLPQSGTGEPK